MALPKASLIESLQIDALAYGGNGVGRLDGKAVFVPLTAPGDVVCCRTVKDKPRFAEAEVVQLLSASALRRTPPCPVFGECGGCQWQHLSYDQQCLWKERIFRDILGRQAGVAAQTVLPLVAAPCEWGYRSRVQFKCRQTEGGFVMGFYRRASHYVVDIGGCPIVHPRINEALGAFRTWLARSPCPAQIPQVDMAVGDDGRIRCVVHFIGRDAGALVSYLEPLAQAAGYALCLQRGRKNTIECIRGAEDLQIRVGQPPLVLAYGPGGFAQVNLDQNRSMVQAVLEAASLDGSERVLDLFCGMGNFSLPLARGAVEVVGVEDYAPSIDKARQNARTNGLRNVSFHARPAEGAALALGEGRPFDLIVLDPPRTGAYGVIKDLLYAAPRRILYVSCDPPTLARDLVPLLHGGYRLACSRPFDLFPQTCHTESVSLLEKAG